jgi:hypothetical protein
MRKGMKYQVPLRMSWKAWKTVREEKRRMNIIAATREGL